MRFGVDVPTWGEAAEPALISRVIREAESLGFESLWFADHIAIPDRFETEWLYDPAYARLKAWTNWFEPLITLTYAAAETRSVRLGTSVILLPLRNPVLAAKQLATVDVLSGGRLVVGVGVGWLKEEYEALGASALFERRGAVLTEYIDVMRRLWTDDVASFSGEFYQLPAVSARPKPLQPNGPPIWIGGTSKVALMDCNACESGGPGKECRHRA
jgi:probable F420-dependent oxidoreductase